MRRGGEPQGEANLPRLFTIGKELVELLEGVINHTHSDEATCPVCRQSLPSGDAIHKLLENAKADVGTHASEARNISDKLQESRAALAHIDSTIKNYNESKARIEANIASHQAVIDANANVSPPAETPEAYRQKIDACVAALGELNAANTSLVQLSRFCILPPREAEISANAAKPIEDINAITAELQEKEFAVTDITERRKGLEEEKAKLEAAEERLKQAEEAYEEAYANAEDDNVLSPMLPTGVAKKDDFMRTRDGLREANDAHVSAKASLETAKDAFARAEEKLERIKERIEKQKVMVQVADELSLLVDAFKPAGIATEYLDYKFRQIADVTQDFLAEMGANFIVMVSEERPMAFDFVRTDDETGTIMFQSKLSGGQKVRLAIAFLMAIHEAVIPDVGLLMLDEPSMHLDTEGVEQLRDMLSELGKRCDSTGAQVIICDHDPTLEVAIQRKEVLS